MEVSRGVINVLVALHALIFVAWTLSVATVYNQPAWFQSGSLGFTHAAVAIVLLMVPMMHNASVRHEAELTALVEATRKNKWANAGAFQRLIEARQRPVTSMDAASARALLVVSFLGLPFIAWYMANTIMAKVQPLASSDTHTRHLATEMWHTDPAPAISVLLLLSVTALLHIVDMVVACLVLAAPTSTPHNNKEEENL